MGRSKAAKERNRKAQRTPEQAAAERERNRQCQQKRRSERTPEQVASEHEADRRRKQKRRSERTAEQVSEDNADRNEKRRRKTASDPTFAISERTRRRKAPLPSKYIARNKTHTPQQHYLGKMDAVCPDCQAKHFECERTQRKKFTSCCGSGSILLPSINANGQCESAYTYPGQFQNWLTHQDPDSRNFRTNIRKYNSMFAFASFGYQPVKFSSGPQALVIHGQVYHKTSVNLQNQSSPQYSQLYFLDPEFANEQRSLNEHNEDCSLAIIQKIDDVIREVNPYAAAVKMMKNVVEQNPPNTKITMWLTKDRQHDPRRYNLPIANEVAAVFVSDDGEVPFQRDIAFQKLGEEGLQNINIISPNCDPMTYPLLFPHGEYGWQPGILKNSVASTADDETGDAANSRNVSMLEFYSYRIQERDFFNPLLHAGKLTQQYIIDAFLKVEGQRLQWSRQNQKTLRVELYLGLMD